MMYSKDIKCDIYVGKKAGSRIFDEIQGARKSIKIISPYLSDYRLDKLISLKRKNIDVKLITSDIERSSFEQSTLRKLLIQKCETDIEAKRKGERWIKISNGMFIGFIISILIETILLAYNFEVKYFLGILPIMGLFICHKVFRILVRNMKIFNYVLSLEIMYDTRIGH